MRVTDPAPGNDAHPAPAASTSEEAGPYERGLTEAARLFASQGYAGTSMRQIADAMGLTMGTIYHYFTSKEDILYQICRSTLSEGFDRLERTIDALSPTSTALDAIKDCLSTHVETIAGSLDAQTTMLTELRSLNGENREEIAGLRRRYASLVESVIARGQAGGALRADISAGVLTILFFNLTNWMIFWFRQDGRLSSDELANAMSAVLVDGIRNGTAPADEPYEHRAEGVR
jgi:AcrR family transcriptional regulator